jgi:CDP-glucose 4,6-dehydratase
MENALGQSLRELSGPLLLTGHTGFKGTWMTYFLEHLSVPVIGYSLRAEKDSMFNRAERVNAIPEKFGDIRDYQTLENFIDKHKPSAIIHLAAQPLVLKSYESPIETFDVNVMGTVNLLDIAFKKDFIKAVIVVTTDKVYRNDNSRRPFVESDPLEGKDPYSASKVGTEAAVATWQQIQKISGGPLVVSVRAGNVIGGGDFALDRLIPDLLRSALTGKSVEIRNPESTRPWQHVLDPLYGYLLTLEQMISGKKSVNLNFGPNATEQLSVREIVEKFLAEFQFATSLEIRVNYSESTNFSELEAQNLSLDSSCAFSELNWQNSWSPQIAVQRTGRWWGNVICNHGNPAKETKRDITDYLAGLEQWK